MMEVLKEKDPMISFKRKGLYLCRTKHPGDPATSKDTTQR
jgi:hypothetical protein